jgi:transcriptional regulator with XRE-family HTH domain
MYLWNMNIEKDYIKLIFDWNSSKRTNKNLSLFGLAKITDLSKSYLNEIEKEKVSQNR